MRELKLPERTQALIEEIQKQFNEDLRAERDRLQRQANDRLAMLIEGARSAMIDVPDDANFSMEKMAFLVEGPEEEE